MQKVINCQISLKRLEVRIECTSTREYMENLLFLFFNGRLMFLKNCFHSNLHAYAHTDNFILSKIPLLIPTGVANLACLCLFVTAKTLTG